MPVKIAGCLISVSEILHDPKISCHAFAHFNRKSMHTPDQRRRRLVFEADEAACKIPSRQCHLYNHLVHLPTVQQRVVIQIEDYGKNWLMKYPERPLGCRRQNAGGEPSCGCPRAGHAVAARLRRGLLCHLLQGHAERPTRSGMVPYSPYMRPKSTHSSRSRKT